MTQCYLGLGANLAEPAKQITDAVKSLQAQPDIQVLRCSSLYGSKPMGPQNQPDYINAVTLIETRLSPLSLLDITQSIENNAGRKRVSHWGPRTLDIDILLLGNDNFEHERLVVPHPGMMVREFVLYPLMEIAPDLILPSGVSIAQASGVVPLNELEKIAPPPTC